MGQFEICGLYGFILFITIYFIYHVVYKTRRKVISFFSFMRLCWNWNTGMAKDHMPQGLGVQVPSTAPKCDIFPVGEVKRTGFLESFLLFI